MVLKLSVLFLLFPALLYKHTVPAQPVTKTECKYYFNQQLKKNVYTQMETEPEYAGGAAAYQRFLNRNIRLPRDIDVNDFHPAHTKMNFIVTEEGKMINPTVEGKSDTSAMTSWEKEVFRIVKLMSKWTPGMCNGKIVAAEVNRPLASCILIETEE